MLNASRPTETIATLHALKRRIYLWALAGGILATLGGWGVRAYGGTFTPYEAVVFPLMAVVCTCAFIALWRTARAAAWVEYLLFAGTALSLLGRLIEILLTPETVSRPDSLAALADLLYWFPLAYILAFLIFENSRRLLVSSLVFLVTLIVVGLVHVLDEWGRPGIVAEAFMLGRFYLANFMYIVLLVASVRLSEQYLRAHTLTEAMADLAHTDPLTGTANRRELDAALARETGRATRHHQPLAMVMFDIDHFKLVNDKHGHEAGDDVLKAAAAAVQGLLRTTDLLGRWGGDEFLIIAPHTDMAQAAVLAERLREALCALAGAAAGATTGSFGVAQYQPPELTAACLKRADDALYAAKQLGRNRVAMSALD